MPRRKGLVAMIRERVREEAGNAIQSLLGGMSFGTRATSRRRRRKARTKWCPGRSGRAPSSVAEKAAQNKKAAVTSRARGRERAGVAGVAVVLAEERAPFADLRAPSVVHAERSRRWYARYERLVVGPRVTTATYVELPVEDLFHLGDAEIVRAEIEEFLTGIPSAPEWGRMLATVLFTDIVGSTERAAALGDAAWRDLLDAHHEVVRRELERYRGEEIGTTGDGFLATFARPARAVRCARAVAHAVQHLGIDVRAGLHTGEVEYFGENLAGIAVHTAARVAALARPGEVLVSSTVKDLVAGSGLRFADRGTHALKGFPDEWRLFAVEQ